MITGSQLEEAERGKVMDYLQTIVKELSGSPFRCRAEVVAYDSVAEGIVDCARREDTDLIAMYTRRHSFIL